METKWHIGCSGFHYKDWKEAFYPNGLPQRKWFDYYCTQFDTLELNVTFYRFPKPAMLDNWYLKSPAGFIFSVKAPRLITHYKQFNDCTTLLEEFYTAISAGLKEKLGPVLFQLPGKVAFSRSLLDKILVSLKRGFINAVEFRNSSWWNQEVFDEFEKHSIVFSGVSLTGLPDTIIQNNPIIYYRFHGVPKLYYSEYSEELIKSFAAQIRSKALIKAAYIYFNNTATMGAIINAKKLMEELAFSPERPFIQLEHID